MDFQLAICRSLLIDESLIAKLRSFDLVLSENIMACGGILAHVLSVPYVNIANGFQPFFNYKIPVSISAASYFPCPGGGSESTALNFLQRLMNLQCWMFSKWGVHHAIHRPCDNLLRELNILPDLTTKEILQRAELHIVLSDFILDVAQPIPPGDSILHLFSFACETPCKVCSSIHRAPSDRNIRYKHGNNIDTLNISSDKNICIEGDGS